MGYWGKRALDPATLPEGLEPASKVFGWFKGHQEVSAQRFKAPNGRLYLRIDCGGGNVEWRCLYGHSHWGKGPFWGHEPFGNGAR